MSRLCGYLQLWWYCHYYGNILPLPALGATASAQFTIIIIIGVKCMFSLARDVCPWREDIGNFVSPFFHYLAKEKEVSGTFLCPAQVIPLKEPSEHHLSFGVQIEWLLLFSFLALFLFSFNYNHHNYYYNNDSQNYATHPSVESQRMWWRRLVALWLIKPKPDG